jgi:peptidoglycan/LPS O-acetylase OafA/YrhL
LAYFIAVVYFVLYAAFASLPRALHIKGTDISYGVYLYGWPAQQLVAAAFPNEGAMFNTVVASLVTVVVAWFSWVLVEKPALSLKNSFLSSGANIDKAVMRPESAGETP